MPSGIEERLTADMKEAMRARETARLDAIRFLRAAMKNAEIEAMHPLNDEEAMGVLRKQAKMRRDSIEQYRKAGREDLAHKEETELAVVDGYLPAAPTHDELRAAVRAAIVETGATGPKDMSAVMRASMARLGGQADGRQVQGIVRDELAALGA